MNASTKIIVHILLFHLTIAGRPRVFLRNLGLRHFPQISDTCSVRRMTIAIAASLISLWSRKNINAKPQYLSLLTGSIP